MKGYKVYVPVLLVALTALSVGFIIHSARREKETAEYRTMVENQYERSFNDLRYAVSNVGLNLDKFAVSTTPSEQSAYLGKVVRYSEMAAEAVSGFSGENGSFSGLEKFFTQTADYAETVIRSLTTGIADAEQVETLDDMKEKCRTIESKLLSVERTDGVSLYKEMANVDSGVAGAFSEMETQTVEYPSLIYDGPFSDSLARPEPKGLDGEEISAEQAGEFVKEFFAVEQVSYGGECGGTVPSYFFTFEKDGDNSLQVTKKGFNIVEYTCSGAGGNGTKSAEECSDIGLEFLSVAGYRDMTAVWASEYDGMIYANYCRTVDGVIIYPEMIKLKISTTDGHIAGMECLNYLLNHTERQFDISDADLEEAAAAIAGKMTVEFVRLALIPLNTKEILTTEVCAKKDEDIYFFYFDVNDGKEVNVLKVVDSEQGRLLK